MELKKSTELWLIFELVRTDNHIEIKNKYKRIFNEPLSDDSILPRIVQEHGQEITELKVLKKNDIESHTYSSGFNRMVAINEIKDEAMSGTPQFDNNGNLTGYKKDLATALKAVTAMKDEAQLETKNQLEILKIMVQSERFNNSGAVITAPQTTNNTEVPSIEVSDIPPSDNDNYF